MASGTDGIMALWLKKCPDMHPSTRYIVVRYNVKIYLLCLKELKKIGEFDDSKRLLYKNRLFNNINMTKAGIIKYYLLNGDIFRLLKTLKALS